MEKGIENREYGKRKGKSCFDCFLGFFNFFSHMKQRTHKCFSTQNLGLTFFSLGLKGLPSPWDHLKSWTYDTTE